MAHDRMKMREMRRISPLQRPILIWGLALFLFFAASACKKKTREAPPPAPAVTVMTPIMREVTDQLDLTGNTQALQTVQLRARVSGYLRKVLFKDGQFVKKNQPLFIIQRDTYEANLRQAEAAISQQQAQLDFASAQYDRYSKLVLRKAASQSDVDNWKFQRDSARANLASARAKRDLAVLDLAYTEIAAPFDGRIDRTLKDPGNLVGSGENTVLAEINQINPLYVYFTISDTDLSRLMQEAKWKPGEFHSRQWPITIGLPSEKEYPHRGMLDFASISLTSTTGSLLMRGIFPNPDGKILPGLYSRIRIPIKKQMAYLVPDEAVSRDQRGSFLLLVGDGNVIQRKGVKTGPLAGRLRAILEGLGGNEWVVIKGMQRAIPGKKVTPQFQDNKKGAG
ncbi:MAG: efflux RND transporter periplasmic adaptor subunit [Syntrophorhabdaceae bacterium]